MTYLLAIILLFFVVEILNAIYAYIVFRLPWLHKITVLGTAFHEGMHALACFLTFTPIHEVKIAIKEGHVKHERSRMGHPGDILISFAPLLGGAIVLYTLTSFLTGLSWSELYALIIGIGDADSFTQLIANTWDTALELIYAIRLTGWRLIITLYLILNIAEAITPSRRDYLNSAHALVGLLTFMFILYLLPAEGLTSSLDFISLQVIFVLTFIALILFMLCIPLGALALLQYSLRK